MSYAALNTQFDLPAPPPRSIFSTVRNVSGRAWFPDFTQDQDPVASLQSFIRILFYPILHKSTFIQLKVLSVLTALVVVSIFLIVLRRMYERSFWLFRLVTRSNGTLIVPNAITAFIAVESVFAILLITLCWQVISWFQHGQSSRYMVLWIGLTWLPLIFGAWCTTIGIFYARPDALSMVSPQPGKPPSSALRMGITPLVVNILVSVIPVLQCVSVVIPAVLAQQQFSIAYEHWLRWAASIEPGAALSRELLLEAQQIWLKVLDAAYYISICMAVWEAWVCCLFFAYCLAGGSLIKTLRDQLATLKSFNQNQAFDKVAHAWQPSELSVAVPNTPAQDTDVDAEKQADSFADPAMLAVQAPPRSQSISSAASDGATLVSAETSPKASASQTMKSARNENKLTTKSRRTGMEVGNDDEDGQTRSMYFTREELENQDQPSRNFFPPVRPSAFARPAKAHTAAGKETTQKRYLEKFYLNFIVQFISLMLCVLFFAIFCGKLITFWYSAWEANDLAKALEIALLTVVWVTIALGNVIMFAILTRTYEPVLSNFGGAVTVSRSSGGGVSGSRRSSLVHGKTASVKLGLRSGKTLSGAKTWAVSTVSQLSNSEDRRSQDIGLDPVRSNRAGSLVAAGRSSLHAYAELDGEQDESSGDRGGKRGVMVEQTVSTIVEDAAVEDLYRIERPARAAVHHSSSRSELPTPNTYEGELFTPRSFSRRSEWADSPVTVWTPSTPPSVSLSMGKKGKGQSHCSDTQGTVTTESEEWILNHSPSDRNLRLGHTRSHTSGDFDDSVGLGIGMTRSRAPWTTPTSWESGRPSPWLMQEDADRRLRMASHPFAGVQTKPS